MISQKEIKNKFARNIKALTLKPALGHSKSISKTRVVNGLKCETKEGDWTLLSDMPTQVGGNASGPTPGVFGRAALGTCLASGYMMWASMLDIPIDLLEIDVEADYDDGGLFGTAEVPAGYLEVRYIVRIQSSASDKTIHEFLDKADNHSPYLDVFSRAQSCKRQVIINP